MAKKLDIYKCAACGNVIEVLTAGDGDLVCCGEPMQLLIEKTADSAKEKHVPVITKVDGGYKVVVGSTIHPMEAEHFIEWIELIADGKAYREFLCPGMLPVTVFKVEASSVSAREYCNKHGLWK